MKKSIRKWLWFVGLYIGGVSIVAGISLLFHLLFS